ncbi:zinc finger MYM-type protein 1-like isoform X4 [Xenia sp. Carnegie-2017]|uniref:zinc finger MYM-type protein 1-like isoform X4 n=1 Tax=Xenia sp. Carnegie-2017 TaxID=2897299 RepID=UPI001F0382F8|nr:zinc finger MYM-type protein 1-like isoform X4 [Xenia sp. Carnegie-2017]
MKNFLSDCKKHEKAKSHMGAYKTWRTYGFQPCVDCLMSQARREEIQRHNEEVRQNREMLKTITEAALYLSRQELAFRGHDESSGSLNRGNYRELLESFAKMGSVFERRLHGRLAETHLAGGGRFTGVSPDIQNDLIDCLDKIIEDEILKEIDCCTFLSIQVDEATDVSTKEQLSVIVQMDKGESVIERQLGFVDVSCDRTATAISSVVKGWDDETLSKVTGLLGYLNGFLFCFLVLVFHRILEQSSILYSILQDKDTDFHYGVSRVERFKAFVASLRNDTEYCQVYDLAVEKVGPPVTRISIHKDILSEKEDANTLHDEVVKKFIENHEDLLSYTNRYSYMADSKLMMSYVHGM